MAPSDYTVNAVETTFRIVETLDEFGEAGVSEIAAEVNASNGTVHKHLNTLRSLGYVRKDGTAYALSFRFLGLGVRTCSRSALVRAAKPAVDALSETADATASLVVLERGYGVHVYRAPSLVAPDESLPTVGERVHVHATAAGKAILSELEWSEVREIIDEVGFPDGIQTPSGSRPERGREAGSAQDSSTNRWGRSIFRLRRELRTVRDRGFAFERGDDPSAAPCVAVPITTDTAPVAAISVSGDLAAMNGESPAGDFVDLVRSAATEIETDLSRR